MGEENLYQAQQIFHYLSNIIQEPNYYIKSLAKYQYTQARLSSYHQQKAINIHKIQALTEKFTNEFNDNYLPPIDDTKFYEIYPSKELKYFVQKYKAPPSKPKRDRKHKNIRKAAKKSIISSLATTSPKRDRDRVPVPIRKHRNKQKPASATLRKRDRVRKEPRLTTSRKGEPGPESIVASSPTLPTMRCNSVSEGKVRPQKTLLIMDYDDTLIPTTMLRANEDKLKRDGLTDKDIIKLDEYIQSLNDYMDKILAVFNNNKDKNIFILTNATNEWVFNKSMQEFGTLFSVKMRAFRKKMAKYNIQIISAKDNEKMGNIAKSNKHKRKWECIEILMEQYFGKKLKGNFDVKLISMGDGRKAEFYGAKEAFNIYLGKQDERILNKINVSLHRINFVIKPKWKQLAEELKYMTKNMEHIVKENHDSMDYIGNIKKGKIVMSQMKRYR